MDKNILSIIFILSQVLYYSVSEPKLSTKEVCEDKSKHCAAWAREGKCKKYGILKRCPKSCKTCENSAISEDIRVSIERTRNVMYAFGSIIVIGAIIGAIKIFTLANVCRSKGSLRGKTAIITGATSGIGLDTALHLAARGAHLILACRNLKKGFQTAKYISSQTKQKFIEVKKLDLSSLDSVRDFANDILTEYEQIDILINNAAIISTRKRKVTRDGHEETFQVNYLSHFLLTNLLLEKLKESNAARIINVVDKSFHTGKINFGDLSSKKFYNNVKAYNDSKLALMIFTQELSDNLHETTVTVNAVNPGRSFTNLHKNVFPYNFKPFWPIFSFYGYIFWNTSNMAAETTYYCALEQNLIDVTGKYFENCSEKPVCKHDKAIAKKLWELSEKLVAGNSTNKEQVYEEFIHGQDCSKSPRNVENDKKDQ